MVIQIDTREKAKAITKIIDTFEKNDIKYVSSKLYVGDYMSLDNPKVIVDRKQNLSEIYQNVCQGHARFKREIENAIACGIRLIILCEHGRGIKTLEDVKNWKNPRLEKSPYAWDGEKLYRVMRTMQLRYGIEWQFCTKAQTGNKILEMLK